MHTLTVMKFMKKVEPSCDAIPSCYAISDAVEKKYNSILKITNLIFCNVYLCKEI